MGQRLTDTREILSLYVPFFHFKHSGALNLVSLPQTKQNIDTLSHLIFHLHSKCRGQLPFRPLTWLRSKQPWYARECVMERSSSSVVMITTSQMQILMTTTIQSPSIADPHLTLSCMLVALNGTHSAAVMRCSEMGVCLYQVEPTHSHTSMLGFTHCTLQAIENAGSGALSSFLFSSLPI
jgi:hypothetical protein